jgi:hypothetical protein
MELDQFANVKAVILEPLKFKSKLAIGEDAYGTLRLKNKLADFWEVFGGFGSGAAVAQSTLVAKTFFAAHGLLGLIGLGTAVTPVGWVVAASVLSGGAVIGVRRFISTAKGERVTIIPKFINTPIDVLAINLFDLIAPLALKVAAVDGQITDDERIWIKNYFVKEWGYDPLFLEAGCKIIESNLDDFLIKEIASKLAEFSEANPDCNYAVMTKDLMDFLRGVMEADGKIDEREEFALEKVDGIFKENGRVFSKKSFDKATTKTKDTFNSLVGKIVSGAETVTKGGKKRLDEFNRK